MRPYARLFLTVIVLSMSGCAGVIPGFDRSDPATARAFLHYQEALRAQHEAGSRVLDRLAGAESRLLSLEAEPAAGFDPNAAAATLGVGDPPRTAAMRRALESLRAYNQSLVAVARGAPEAALVSGTDLIGALLPAETGNAGEAFARLNAATRRLWPVLGLMRRSDDRDRLQAALTGAAPRIQDLLRAIRAATPAIYAVLYAAEVEPGNLENADGIPPAGHARLKEDRRMLAGWVLLIDQSMVAVEVAAVAAPAGGRADAALIGAAIRLRALAEAVSAARRM